MVGGRGAVPAGQKGVSRIQVNSLKTYGAGAGARAVPRAVPRMPSSPERGRQALHRRKQTASKGVEELDNIEDVLPEASREEEIQELSNKVSVLKSQKKNAQRKLDVLRGAHTELLEEHRDVLQEVEVLRGNNIGHVPLDDHLALQEKMENCQEDLVKSKLDVERAAAAQLLHKTNSELRVAALAKKLKSQQELMNEQLQDSEKRIRSLELEIARCAVPQMYSSSTQTVVHFDTLSQVAFLARVEHGARHSLESALLHVLSRCYALGSSTAQHLRSTMLQVNERCSSEVAVVNDCNLLLRHQMDALQAKVKSLQEAAAVNSREAAERWEELTGTKAQLMASGISCDELSAQVLDLTSRLTRSLQKSQALTKIRKELRTSESERTRIHSEHELMKEKQTVTAELQERLKKDLEDMTETCKQRSALILSLETQVEELRKVSKTKSLELALVRDLKAQQHHVTEETQVRLTLMHDTVDSFISIVRSERQSRVQQFETNCRDEEQTELMQLVQGQREQLAMFNDRIEKMHTEHMSAVLRLECRSERPQTHSLASPPDNGIVQDSARYAPQTANRASINDSFRSQEGTPLELPDPGKSVSAAASPVTPSASPEGALLSDESDRVAHPTPTLSSRPLMLTVQNLTELARETGEKEDPCKKLYPACATAPKTKASGPSPCMLPEVPRTETSAVSARDAGTGAAAPVAEDSGMLDEGTEDSINDTSLLALLQPCPASGESADSELPDPLPLGTAEDEPVGVRGTVLRNALSNQARLQSYRGSEDRQSSDSDTVRAAHHTPREALPNQARLPSDCASQDRQSSGPAREANQTRLQSYCSSKWQGSDSGALPPEVLPHQARQSHRTSEGRQNTGSDALPTHTFYPPSYQARRQSYRGSEDRPSSDQSSESAREAPPNQTRLQSCRASEDKSSDSEALPHALPSDTGEDRQNTESDTPREADQAHLQSHRISEDMQSFGSDALQRETLPNQDCASQDRQSSESAREAKPMRLESHRSSQWQGSDSGALLREGLPDEGRRQSSHRITEGRQSTGSDCASQDRQSSEPAREAKPMRLESHRSSQWQGSDSGALLREGLPDEGRRQSSHRITEGRQSTGSDCASQDRQSSGSARETSPNQTESYRASEDRQSSDSALPHEALPNQARLPSDCANQEDRQNTESDTPREALPDQAPLQSHRISEADALTREAHPKAHLQSSPLPSQDCASQGRQSSESETLCDLVFATDNRTDDVPEEIQLEDAEEDEDMDDIHFSLPSDKDPDSAGSTPRTVQHMPSAVHPSPALGTLPLPQAIGVTF